MVDRPTGVVPLLIEEVLVTVGVVLSLKLPVIDILSGLDWATGGMYLPVGLFAVGVVLPFSIFEVFVLLLRVYEVPNFTVAFRGWLELDSLEAGRWSGPRNDGLNFTPIAPLTLEKPLADLEGLEFVSEDVEVNDRRLPENTDSLP